MPVQLIRWGMARAMPWKNGGGITHELAVFPETAGLEDFGWRLSMAEVASDGPFSAFTGIHRTLALVDGAGIGLDFGAEEKPSSARPAPSPASMAAFPSQAGSSMARCWISTS
ncbi:HutD family protein [Pannonibacter sp. Pt2-lr]